MPSGVGCAIVISKPGRPAAELTFSCRENCAHRVRLDPRISVRRISFFIAVSKPSSRFEESDLSGLTQALSRFYKRINVVNRVARR